MTFRQAWTTWALVWALVFGGVAPVAPMTSVGLSTTLGIAAAVDASVTSALSLRPSAPHTLDRPASASRLSFGALSRSERLLAELPSPQHTAPQVDMAAGAPPAPGAGHLDVIHASLPGRAPPTSPLA